MRVLMLGWEFPPFISGGLGTACYGLTKALGSLGAEVTFVLPRGVNASEPTHVRLMSAPVGGSAPDAAAVPSPMNGFEHVTFRLVDAQLNPYQSPGEYQAAIESIKTRAAVAGGVTTATAEATAATTTLAPPAFAAPYGGDLFSEVQRYAALALDASRTADFEVIHAHDWMTFPAGLAVAAATGKPLVVHVHSTEFDRSGSHIDQRIYDIERRGMHGAMKVICVSHFTKNVVEHNYGIAAHKVDVVYNAVESNGHFDPDKYDIKRNEKIVLFLGRITQQKGPDYFLAAAKKVLEVMDNVKFIIAGSGDMTRHTIEMAASMGIGHKVLFTGFLRGTDVERVYKMADLYVMPSVSEPFGIAPLEAVANDVPVLISKQSGVSEVLLNALKVDFWDTNEMANKIIAVLRHPPLGATLREHGAFEVRKMNWSESAKQCLDVYEKALHTMNG